MFGADGLLHVRDRSKGRTEAPPEALHVVAACQMRGNCSHHMHHVLIALLSRSRTLCQRFAIGFNMFMF